MEPSVFAVWLDTAFAGLDQGTLAAIHTVQQSGADVVLGPLARLFALLGSGGVGMILLGLGLLAFRRTRRFGAGVLLGLVLGFLCTNLLLKPLVARPRPYADPAGILFRYWVEAGSSLESDASFPSGHATACTAAMSALFFLGNGRRRWLYFLPVLVMGLSRMYLVVHYPTDVLAGTLIGLAAGAAAAALIGRNDRNKPQNV